ncbi:MAG: SDR family oxidoreductase [Chloroherpetonaceae bacterium]|nr:SDR family oxidoreductase [Chloroherpetonaceae bacterium]MCS7212599.1 SDR family oxidoreductase [Chloroherpetonaceae bacterium]MDW8019460.1 SDR family oxidoreductase [Chloroherpetonaceae bacterium]
MALKVFLTGASGLLGGNILRHLALRPHLQICAVQRHASFTVPAAFSLGHPVLSLDLSSENDVWNVLSNWRPNVIIHTAAMSDPVACEWQRDAATVQNILVTRLLARLAEHFGARFIFISTDLVFDGEKGNYQETDTRRPLSFYGATKAISEDEIAQTLEDYAVLRTTIMLGYSPRGTRSLNERLMLDIASERTPTLFIDEYRSPIAVDTLAKIVVEFALDDAREARGIFHAVGNERLSRYEIGKRIFERFGVPPHRYRSALLSEVVSTPPRPRDCSLDNRKLLSIIKTRIPSFDEMIRAL